MTYDINRIEKEFAAACQTMKVELDTPILINNRLRTTLGRVCYKRVNNDDEEAILPSKIEFSKNFILNSSDEDIKEVILHEAAHYIAITLTGERHGHDKYFKSICEKIGTANDKTFFVDKENSIKTKYTVKCPHCGFENAYSRRGKVINNVENYSCGVCGCKELEVIQNW